jgi:autotransporter-associated beta strand protein
MIAGYQSVRLGKKAILATTIAVLCGAQWSVKAQFEITTGVGNTSQNFDGLISTGTSQAWANDATLATGDSTLDGWSLFNSLNAAITTYNASNGSSSTGSFYSFGTDASDRALGGVGSGGSYFGSPASGAIAGYITFAATNTSAATLTSFNLGFAGEQWRDGGNTTQQSMVLEYGFGNTFDTVTWTAPGGNFDWTGPVATATAAPVDGNVAGLVNGRGGTVNGLNWTTGQTLWIRWIERNDQVNDHGLAIDNFMLSWTGSVIAVQYWDANGSTAGIGGNGAWSATSLTWNPQQNGTGPTQAFDPNGQLIFGGTAGTVTIAAAGVTVNGPLRFDASGYTITATGAGKLTLASGSAIEITDGVLNTTISAPISGSNGFIKTGPGSLQLSGVNDFSGNIMINNGALIFDQDVRLGNANNAIVLNSGVLSPSATVALAATRNISGTGSIRVQMGQTLTFNGNATLGPIILTSNDATHANGGEVNFSGTNNSVGTLTFDNPVRVTAPNGLTLNGDVTMPDVTNPVRMTGQITLAGSGGARKFTVVDTSQDVDFLIEGGVLGSSRLHKVGDGTLKLEGNNSAAFTGGVRLGTAGATTEPGGRLIIDDPNDLGTGANQQIQFNDGILHSLTNLTGANAIPAGISLGAGQVGGAQLGFAAFSGSPMEFLGAFQLFKPNSGNIVYPHQVRLDTSVTISGPFDSTGPTDTKVMSVVFTGTGSATFKAPTNSVIDAIEVDGPSVSINGELTSTTATVLVKNGRFGGNATLAGDLAVGDNTPQDVDDAFLSPGDGIGNLAAASLAFQSDGVLKLEINSSLPVPSADKLTISASVTLGDGVAKLDASDLGNAILQAPLTLVIIENTSVDSTTGHFEGLLDGAQLLIGNNLFRIEYDFGLGANDVALVLIPEPTAISGLLLGAGLLGLRRRRPVIC